MVARAVWAAGEEMFMFRKLFSVVAVLAVLPLLTAGAVQARPLAAHPAAPAVLQELWQWVTSGSEKEGAGMDPNGQKSYHPRPDRSLPGTGTNSERAGARVG